MKKFFSHKIFISGISLAILIIIFSFYFSSRQTDITNSTATWVAHTQEVLFHTERLLLHATNIETGARAFILTGQQPLPDLFAKSKLDLQLEIQAIKRLTADNASQQVRLDSITAIINKTIVWLGHIAQPEKGMTHQRKQQNVNNAEEAVYSEKIRSLVYRMQDEENRLLIIRQYKNGQAILLQHRLFMCSILVMLFLLLYIFWKEKGLYIKKQKEAEGLLFRNLVESAPDAMVIADEHKNIIFINQQAEILFNYDKKQLVGLPVRSLIRDNIDSGPGKYQSIVVAIKNGGDSFPAEVRVAPVQTGEGILLAVSARDITERNRSDELLKKSETLFRLLVTGIKDYAIFMLDRDGMVASWNSGAEHIKGYTEKEILGQSFQLFYSKEDIQKGDPFHNLQMAGEHGRFEQEGWRVRKDGSRFWANVVFTALKDTQGNIYGFSKITRDITERKQAQEKLEFLSRQIEQSHDAIYIVDADRKLRSWNKGAENLYGYKKEEVLGKDPNIVLHTDITSEKLQSILQELRTIEYWTGEIKRTNKSGEEIYVRSSTTSVQDGQGNITGYISAGFDITGQKKLLQEVTHLAGIVEQSSEAIFSSDMDKRIISWNRGAEKLFGFSKQEIIGRTAEELEFIHLSGIEMSAVEQQIAANGEWTAEMNYYHRDGSSFFGAVTANMVRNEKGAVTSFNFIIKDISLRKQLEEHLQQSNQELEKRVAERTAEITKNEQRFRLLIENSTEAIALTDAFSNNLYRSNAAQKMIGPITNADTISRTHPEDLAKLTAIQQEVMENPGVPISFQGRFLHASGHYIWLEGTFNNLLDIQGVNAIVANYRDITKRKELEDLLNKANVLARMGGWEIDLKKGTVYWTDITREIHETAAGYLPDLTASINFYKAGKARDVITQRVKEAVESGKPWDVELQIITAKNNERWVRSIGETEFIEGTCARIYGSFQDIDERKKTEEKIKKINIELEERVTIRTAQLKKTNDELEAFSYSVSHDLRSPLRAIAGFVAKLETVYSSQLDEEAIRIMTIIKNNTLKMGQLIDDLLSFSRLGRKEINKLPIDNNSMVKDIVNVAGAGHNHTIEWIIHPLPAINADINTIRQVWINLITNAVKYSSKAAAPKIEIGSYRQNGMVAFFVKDNGIGFDEHYKGKLFKVFQRLHSAADFEGTGIGLAIVERIVSKHGGTVSASGVVNEGACFSFFLPQ